MEELAEGVIKSALRLVGIVVRSVIWLVWDLWFEVLAWYVGWPICRVLSLGAFPKESLNEHERASTLVQISVSVIGLIALVGFTALIAILVGAGNPKIT